MSWSQATFWLCIGALLTMLLGNLLKLAQFRRKRNKRIGLPAPACQRFPDWTPATTNTTVRELPGMMRRHAD